MDELSSTEFRKRFARLTSPTVVTVNGHPIGEWRPVQVSVAYMLDRQRQLKDFVVLEDPVADAAKVRAMADRYNTRPFTPVPKRRG